MIKICLLIHVIAIITMPSAVTAPDARSSEWIDRVVNLPPSTRNHHEFSYSRFDETKAEEEEKEELPRSVVRTRTIGRPPQRNRVFNPGLIEYSESSEDATSRERRYYEDDKYSDMYDSRDQSAPMLPVSRHSSSSLRSTPSARPTLELPLPPPRLSSYDEDRRRTNNRERKRVNSNPNFTPYVPPYAGFEERRPSPPATLSARAFAPVNNYQRTRENYRNNNNNNNNNNHDRRINDYHVEPPKVMISSPVYHVEPPKSTSSTWDYGDSYEDDRSIAHEPAYIYNNNYNNNNNNRYTIIEPPITVAPSTTQLPKRLAINTRYEAPKLNNNNNNNNVNNNNNRNSNQRRNNYQSSPYSNRAQPPAGIPQHHRPATRPTPPPIIPVPTSKPPQSYHSNERMQDSSMERAKKRAHYRNNTSPEALHAHDVLDSGVPAEHGQPFGLIDYEEDINNHRRSAQVTTSRPARYISTAVIEVKPKKMYNNQTPKPVQVFPTYDYVETNQRNRGNRKRQQTSIRMNPSVPIPASRPEKIYPASTEPLSNAIKCDPRLCRLPDCNCGSSAIPGGLQKFQVPQIVMLTFDDAINDLNLDIYEELFSEKRKNPNGCPLLGTFYVSHEWTDYGSVQTLYSKGHEMASHGITHSHGEKFSKNQWQKEIAGQREILHLYGGVKLEDVRGMRAPFLQVGGNRMFEALYDDNFTYDSSMPVLDNKPPFWPYTLDYALNHECMIPPCPSKSFPGIWEVGMVMLEDERGGRCSMADACTNPSDENGVYNMLIKNFKRHYETNRAPFGLYYHSAWFNTPHHRKGFIRFMDEILSYGDVFFTTKWQMLQWMRDPTPLNELDRFQPWDCNAILANRPPPCSRAKVCSVQGEHGHQQLKTCQPCPKTYPWVGNNGLRKNG